jgi:hypothetical protein
MLKGLRGLRDVLATWTGTRGACAIYCPCISAHVLSVSSRVVVLAGKGKGKESSTIKVKTSSIKVSCYTQGSLRAYNSVRGLGMV